MEKPKQVIVVRRDLKMGKGKLAAQVAHASLKAVLDSAHRRTLGKDNAFSPFSVTAFAFDMGTPIHEWLFNEAFTKIVVYVESEKELEIIEASVHQMAGETNSAIPYAMIVDSGRTEFNGIPTKTCVAVGPYTADIINSITGHLPLL